MVKLSLLVAVGAIAAAVAYPVSEDDQTIETDREIELRQSGILSAIFGQIGTALVPLVGAILGPILTNLAAGISDALNTGINSAAPTKEESAEAEATGLVVRIPQDSPLYAFLLAHPSLAKEGLPSVGPAQAPFAQKPLVFGGKFATASHPDTSDPAKLHVDDSIAVEGSDNDDEDEEEKITRNPNVKRYPQRVKTQTDYA